jgi:hypothetical protein
MNLTKIVWMTYYFLDATAYIVLQYVMLVILRLFNHLLFYYSLIRD